MNQPINDGGPAFPAPLAQDAWGDIIYSGDEADQVPTGMSLRDWFAGQALPQVDARSHGTPDDVAKECYMLADAMLKARGGGQ